jgi:DNA invertase Pin-like site-specific DNA recombinase
VRSPPLPDAARTIGYARISTEEQSANGQSHAVQEAQLRGWAQMTERRIDQVVIEGGYRAAYRAVPAAIRADRREIPLTDHLLPMT